MGNAGFISSAAFPSWLPGLPGASGCGAGFCVLTGASGCFVLGVLRFRVWGLGFKGLGFNGLGFKGLGFKGLRV